MLKGKTIARRLKDRLFSFVAYNVKYVMLSSWKKKKKNEDKGLYIGALRQFAEHSVKVLVWANIENGNIEITVMPL